MILMKMMKVRLARNSLNRLRGVKAWVSKHLAIMIFIMGRASVSIVTLDYHIIL